MRLAAKLTGAADALSGNTITTATATPRASEISDFRIEVPQLLRTAAA